ncbi:MAG: metallophosphoesterase family protein [Candidatus Bilamarchaeaceae archaeon]
MKILALSDLHTEEEALQEIRGRYARIKPDYTFILGDITNQSLNFSEEVAGSFKNLFVIPGNNDPPGSMRCFGDGNIHGKSVKLGEYNLTGFGYSNPTPFNTPNELGEDEIYSQMKKLWIDSKTILLTHTPPFGHFDEVHGGEHIGSASVLRIIEERKPFLHFCGHVHADEGVARIGPTTVVKVPALSKYKYCVCEVHGKDVSVEFPDCE